MRRATALLLPSLVLAGCGARTGLGGERIAGDAQVDDGPTEADAPDVDAQVEAGPRLCPTSPPRANTSCPAGTMSGTACIYVTPPDRVDWCCLAGGWVNCTTISGATESCSQVVCTAGVPVECIDLSSHECCFCDTPTGTVSACGPC